MSASISKPASVAEAARPTAVEALAEKLRTRILNGDFAPGEYLRDIRMAEEYEVSRNTFRTAAQLLVGRRILRQVVNRGFFVPEFSADDIVDVTRFRGVLEAEAVKMIVHTGQIPVEAINAVERLRHAPVDAPVSFMVAADRDFHRAIVSASGSERLQRSYEAIESEIELLLVQQRQHFYQNPKEIVREHEHLIACLKTRDFAAARDAFLEHWDDLRVKLLRVEANKLRAR
ncbi:GntR family transcriptional regulator [Paraburkholderia phytofirmans]|uniref:GntR family transcriptional regulator n=1 Tax=Paraburkholderia phytofirmans TaxID=261302 RepID=UPI0038B90F34